MRKATRQKFIDRNNKEEKVEVWCLAWLLRVALYFSLYIML
jgi:hypothetical protein